MRLDIIRFKDSKVIVPGGEVIDLRKQLLVLDAPQPDRVVMVLPYLIDVIMNRLKVLLRLDRGVTVCLGRLFDLVNQVGKDLVSVQVKQILQELILVIEVVHLDDESVNFLDLVHHVQVLLCLDGVEDPLGFFAELWQLE